MSGSLFCGCCGLNGGLMKIIGKRDFFGNKLQFVHVKEGLFVVERSMSIHC